MLKTIMMPAFLKIFCRVFFRVQVTGFENLPKKNKTGNNGKLLILANHESLLDHLFGLFPPVLAAFVVHFSVLNNWMFRQMLRFTPYLAKAPRLPNI